MNFSNFLKLKRATLPDSSSPEETVGRRLEDVRLRSNRLKMERALFDILAVALAALFAWYILARLVSLPSFGLYVCIGVLAAFAVFRILHVKRSWTDKGDAAALVDGEMKLKQRLVTFIEYSSHKVKPRLYDRLADEIITDLGPDNIRKILPHRIPASAYVALAIALAFILDISLRLSGREGVRNVSEESKREERLALGEDEKSGEASPTPTPESKSGEGGAGGKEETVGRREDSKQMAQMRQDLSQMMQNISQQLDRMEAGTEGSSGGASGGKSPQSGNEQGSKESSSSRSE